MVPQSADIKFRALLLAGVFAAARLVGPSAAATVSGEVTDTGGNPVAGARITFANKARVDRLADVPANQLVTIAEGMEERK